MNFIFDIINLQFVVIISFLSAAYYLRSEPLKVFLLFGHIIVIFLLNDVLFSPSYFGDQLRQVDATKTIRSEFFDTEAAYQEHGSKMGFPSLILAAIPLPFINSVQSLALINFLIFLLIFMLIKKYGVSSNSADYFYLLFPSLLLYSSLALRDTLILFFMFVGLYQILVKEKYIWGLFLFSPLLVFKFQNYLMIIAAMIMFHYLKTAGRFRYGLLAMVITMGAFVPEKIPVIAEVYERLETWRLALFHDQYMYDWEYIEQMDINALYEPLGTGFILLYQIVKYFLYMLLKPLPWECDNPFQFIQSAENLVIFGMIIWINRKKIFSEKIKQKILYLNCLLLVSMTINGLVVFNFGSAVRYKFPFIVIYFVYFFYLLKSDELFVHQAKTAWNGNSPISPTLSID